MGKDSEPLRSGKGRALNVKVAQTCLALHVSHQFTHFAATDGGKDHEDEMAEDRKYVPNPRVAYGVFEGPTLEGKSENIWRSMPNLARGSARSENSSGEQFGVASRAKTVDPGRLSHSSP